MSTATQAEVISLIETALKVQSGVVHVGTCAEDILDWDSMGQLTILADLDNLYSGKIASITEMAEADSVEKIFSILKTHSLLT